MPCLLCDSDDHLTQNCDKYVTDVERNRYLFSINTCKFCKSSYDKYNTWCIKCEPETKCLSCFSRQHHTFFCPVRETIAPKWFVPKIDQSLLNRFFNMFDPLEQYSVVTSAPAALNYIKLKAVNVIKNIYLANLKTLLNDTIYVVDNEARVQPMKDEDNIKFDQTSAAYLNFMKAVSNNLLFIKARVVTLKMVVIPSEGFFYLISNNTKIVYCSNVIFTTNIITFNQILQRLPNVQELSLIDSNIEVENGWVEDLKIYGTKISSIKMDIKNFDFNAKDLAEIVKTQRIQISLVVDGSINHKVVQSLLMAEKFSNYFTFSSSKYPLTFYRLCLFDRCQNYFHYLSPI